MCQLRAGENLRSTKPHIRFTRRSPPPTRANAFCLPAKNSTGSLDLCAEKGAEGRLSLVFSWRRSHWRTIVAASRDDIDERVQGVSSVSWV